MLNTVIESRLESRPATIGCVHCLFNQQVILSLRREVNRAMKLTTASTPIPINFQNSMGADKINTSKRNGLNALFTFDDIIGESRGFKKSVALAKRFACCPENILINGESGTGKELFAHSIHNLYRPFGPFIAINCAAIPKNLIESELFGYESGSFTGAERNGSPGKIELASGGTLFLDEIGDMPLELQSVLLRVLEDKQVMRIGGKSYKKVDFRLIAATNKDLNQLIQEKLFREDLYYRLSVLSINIPPLRQREDDVILLCKSFIQDYCARMGLNIPHLKKEVIETIKNYGWPGNVRQLKNAIIYALNAFNGETIQVDDLPAYVFSPVSPPIAMAKAEPVKSLKVVEKKAIEVALLETGNNISKSAELLGIGKTTLYRKIKQYAINY